MKKPILAAIGNVYVETNYLGLKTGGKDSIEIGKEYRAAKYETRLGGSVVNFALQAKLLESEVWLVGKVGDDDNGKSFLNLLVKAEISSNLITISKDPDVQTSIDTGLVLEHSGENIQVVAGNANQLLSKNDVNLLNPYFTSVNAVYLGGFLKQESLYKDYPKLLKQFAAMGIKIFLDHGRIPVDINEEKRQYLLQSLPYIHGYLPNKDEIVGISGKSGLEKAIEWALTMGVDFVTVKLGSKGCQIKTKDKDIEIPGKKVRAISTVGAGDAFNAGFITQYLQGKDLRFCGEFANTTAALKVSSNKNPNLQQVLEFLYK